MAKTLSSVARLRESVLKLDPVARNAHVEGFIPIGIQCFLDDLSGFRLFASDSRNCERVRKSCLLLMLIQQGEWMPRTEDISLVKSIGGNDWIESVQA